VRRSTALTVIVYTALRLGLFVILWLIIDKLTPLGTLWSAVAAILISGALSVVLLDRQRGAMAQAVGGFFDRINQRIERSASAEDEADERARSAGAGHSSEREQDAHNQPEGKQQ